MREHPTRERGRRTNSQTWTTRSERKVGQATTKEQEKKESQSYVKRSQPTRHRRNPTGTKIDAAATTGHSAAARLGDGADAPAGGCTAPRPWVQPPMQLPCNCHAIAMLSSSSSLPEALGLSLRCESWF